MDASILKSCFMIVPLSKCQILLCAFIKIPLPFFILQFYFILAFIWQTILIKKKIYKCFDSGGGHIFILYLTTAF